MLTIYEESFLRAGEECFKRISRKANEINWEQRRYEIAKDIISSTCSSENNGSQVHWFPADSDYCDTLTTNAVMIADALIDKLKKTQK